MIKPWKGVYFAQVNPVMVTNRDRGGPIGIRPSPESLIKIGWSSDVLRRVREMQTAHVERLFVVGLIESVPREYERRLHRAYRDLRTSGEWFKPSAELIGFVAGIGIPDDFLSYQQHFWIRSVLRRPLPPRGALIAENPEIML